MKNFVWIYVVVQILAEASKENNTNNEKSPLASTDQSTVVNGQGLLEPNENNHDLTQNKMHPPEGQKQQNIQDVAKEAARAHLQAVSSLIIYADPSAIVSVPETVFQVADNKLERGSKTDEQVITYGPELEGYKEAPKNEKTKEEGNEKTKEEGNEKEDVKDNEKEGEKDNEKEEGGNDDANTSESPQDTKTNTSSAKFK